MTDARRISLLDTLDEDWIKLPLGIMQDVGPAVQTLGGLLKVTHRETFVPVGRIASEARIPLATVRKHLGTLHNAAWIVHAGREETRGGRLRRTATIKLPKKTIENLEPYGILPWWACCRIKLNSKAYGHLPWSARAVLSVVMARLCGFKKVVDDADGQANLDPEDMAGSIENMGGADRCWRFPLGWLTRQTGLDHKSVSTAKVFLNHGCGIIRWYQGMEGELGGAHILEPNWDFGVIVTPAPKGGVFLAFDGYGKSGQ